MKYGKSECLNFQFYDALNEYTNHELHPILHSQWTLRTGQFSTIHMVRFLPMVCRPTYHISGLNKKKREDIFFLFHFNLRSEAYLYGHIIGFLFNFFSWAWQGPPISLEWCRTDFHKGPFLAPKSQLQVIGFLIGFLIGFDLCFLHLPLRSEGTVSTHGNLSPSSSAI